MQLTRRRFLKGAAALAAITGASQVMPRNLARRIGGASSAGARAAKLSSVGQIKHVVVLLQENRSFDHYFGTLSGVRGFGDRNPLKLDTGRSVFYQPDPDSVSGYLLPFHLDTCTTSAETVQSTDHEWDTQHRVWDGGKLDKWVTAHLDADGKRGALCMGYYEREDIPFHFALADLFTVCDRYHCSLLGPTYPNRMYWMTGTIDPGGRHGGPMISNARSPNGTTWTTYAERLEAAGVPWQVYCEPEGEIMNVLKFFRTFQDASPRSQLARRAALRPTSIGQFEYDAMRNKLPTVSWIIPPWPECEHPNQMPAAGAAFIASKLDAICANPDVWASTVFILSYDENDGLFDHVAPPVPPPGTPGEFVGKTPIGAGFRVPCIVVSPWTVGGWVCSDLYDHTSVLRLLEHVTGVREPNITEWRRRTFGDFLGALRFGTPELAAPPTLPDTMGRLNSAKFEAAHLARPKVPRGAQPFPEQEPVRGKPIGSV